MVGAAAFMPVCPFEKARRESSTWFDVTLVPAPARLAPCVRPPSRSRLAAEMRTSTGCASTSVSSAARASSSQGRSRRRLCRRAVAGVASVLSIAEASGRMWKSASNSALQTSCTSQVAPE